MVTLRNCRDRGEQYNAELTPLPTIGLPAVIRIAMIDLRPTFVVDASKLARQS
jgi:hypothetical protein